VGAAREGSWVYDDSYLTDQNEEEIILMCVKEKLLESLTEEIPYTVKPVSAGYQIFFPDLCSKESTIERDHEAHIEMGNVYMLCGDWLAQCDLI